MPNPLTDQERRVLDYIVAYLQTNTYQPSIREIGREFSIKSTKTVSELLQSLADKGWIERDPSRSRGVRLLGLEMQPDMVSLPLYQAPAVEDVSAAYLLDRKLVNAAGAWLLVMDDDHLAEHGVRAGDLLVVEPVPSTEICVGDFVVMNMGGAVVVRRCGGNGPTLRMEPARSSEVAATLTATQAEAVVQGCVSTIVRRLRSTVAAPALAVTVPGS